MIAPDRRLALLKKVHVARKAIDITEDDYRALLIRVAGVASAKDCSIDQLADVVAEFERLGFRPIGPAVPRRPSANHPVARKARALWISLHQIGAIDDGSERALETFSKRQLGVDRLQWADQRQGYRLIEALKAIGERHGWDQSVPARVPPTERLWIVKSRLVGVLLAKLAALGVAPIGAVAGDRSGWSMGEMDTATRHLALQLDTARKAAR